MTKTCEWCGKESDKIKKRGTAHICLECRKAVRGPYLMNLTEATDLEDYYKTRKREYTHLCAALFPLLKPQEYPVLEICVLNPPWLAEGLQDGTIVENEIEAGTN